MGMAMAMGFRVKKCVVVSIRTCYRSVRNYPFLFGLLCFFIFLYRSCPFLFSLLVSATPVLICTAVLLGTLLSFGQPNLPEIETEEEEKVSRDVASLRSEILGNATVAAKENDRFTVERFEGNVENSYVERGSVEQMITRKLDEHAGFVDFVPVIHECNREIQFDKGNVEEFEHAGVEEFEKGRVEVFEKSGVEEFEKGEVEDAAAVKEFHSSELEERREIYERDLDVKSLATDDEVAVENQLLAAQSMRVEILEVEDRNIPIEPVHKVNHQNLSLNDKDDHDENYYNSSGSEFDGAESSSPDASIADIIPLLDELHPLLDSETPQPAHRSDEESGASSEHSHKSDGECPISDDGNENQGEEDSVVEHDEDDDEGMQEEKEDESKSAIKWTEDDQKNLMDLGSLELERNQRLENLIARRRARNNMRMLAGKNLIDLDGFDLPVNVPLPPISTNRRNPFDLPYDSYSYMGLPPIPGSAPSILLPRHNPFDLPYDPNEEKPDLKSDDFGQELLPPQQKDMFRRHESFSVGPSNFAFPMQEQQNIRWKPYFMPEKIAAEGTSYSPLERQFSEASESKLSSVSDTESMSSIADQDDKKSDGSHFLDTTAVSYLDPTATGIEHGNGPWEDTGSEDYVQENREVHHEVVEITLGSTESHFESQSGSSEIGAADTLVEINASEIHSKNVLVETDFSSNSSLSSISGVNETIFDVKTDEAKPSSHQTEESGIDTTSLSALASLEEDDFKISSEVLDDNQHREPVYDSSATTPHPPVSINSQHTKLQVLLFHFTFTPLSFLCFSVSTPPPPHLHFSATMGASLPPKEANLFKLIVKSYETKQYKKGLKAADQILKKFPEHGETLSMKGLTLNCMDRKAEAYELVRLGLKNDLKSHVCWHVYGLLYRSDREYREAIKCYRNALKIDPDNIEILRDLSLLQAQMRDLKGFVETRQQLLTLKPNHRMNWIGFSVAHHLNSNPSKAVEILEAYEGTLEDDYPPESERCEHGEMLLYKISLLDECGSFERALGELRKKELKIVDKLSYKEQEVSLLVKLGHLEEGEKLYKTLLAINPDNYRYYEGLQVCVGLFSKNSEYSPEEIERLDELYKSLGQQNGWSSAVKRIPLDFLQGDKFKDAADNYIRPLLTKGVPSLFSDLSPLYDQPGKADILEQLILWLENSIRLSGQYPGSIEKEPPSTLMWILFLLAQHYDRRGQYDIALSKIDEAIKHTPTVIDLYSVKSRILKHAGDAVASAALADEARCMDLADRYINSDCVKRMLQADQVALAEKTAVLFTKDGDQHNNLHDMQCMWYELASGESYFRQGDLGRALKNFLAVEKHYADITEDQFDFHSYCLRKMTLRAYVDMLRFQDRLHSEPYFQKAAIGAIRCYIKLYDSPPKSSTGEDDDMSNLLPSQKKKMRQRQRKAEARAKKEADVKNEETNNSGVSKSGKRHVKPVDTDPHGEKLVQVEDPLLEATKYLKLLQKHSPDSLDTHVLSFEVNMRKQKILLAFQAVKQLLRLDAEHPDSHRCLIKFFCKVDSMPAPTTDGEKLVWSVLDAERPLISQVHERSLMESNEVFLEKHKDSLMHRAAVAEMLNLLEPQRKPEAIKLIEESTNGTVPRNGALGPIKEWKLKECIAIHKLLETVLIDHAAASRWKTRCSEFFPYSTYFEGSLSSAIPNSVNNQISKDAERVGANRSANSISDNGKLDGFKELTI